MMEEHILLKYITNNRNKRIYNLYSNLKNNIYIRVCKFPYIYYLKALSNIY